MSNQYVAVYGSEEDFGEIVAINSHQMNYFKKQLCADLIRRLGLTTPRSEPKSVEVEVFSLKIQNRKLRRVAVGKYAIDLPFAAMTEVEYERELTNCLAGVPPQFRPFVRSQAWERGHSAGYEEVLGIARELVSELSPCILEFWKFAGDYAGPARDTR